jgi:V/A-type H+-transporting ATPase subunit C
MDYGIFAQSVARIKALETRLLSRSKLDSLIEAKDFPDCIRILQDSPYGPFMTMQSYEEGLRQALQEFYQYMYKIIPLREIVDILAIRYDGHNIKSLLKGRFSGNDTSGILISIGTIPLEVLKIMVYDETYKNIPEVLASHVQRVMSVFKNSHDPQDIDIIIDKGMFEYSLKTARDSKMDYLVEFVKVSIDIANIKTFIRIKAQGKGIDFLEKAFIPGGKLSFNIFSNFINDPLEKFAGKIMYTDYSKWSNDGIGEYIRNGDLGKIEKFGDNYIINYIKKSKFISLGPEPLVAYMVAKENEIRALRIIMTGKKNEVHPDIIRERMRDVYV